MSNQNAIIGHLDNSFGNLIKFGSTSKHCIVNTCKLHYKRLNRNLRIDQTYKLIHDFVAVKFINSNFGNSLFVELPSGCFYVKYCVQISCLFLLSVSKYTASNS